MKPLKILIIDDDKKIQLLISEMLTKEGFFCILASSGEDAAKIMADNKIDLIILDLFLPGIQGLEYLKMLKSNETSKEIPIIICTGVGKEHDMTHGLELGADDYFMKPISSKILLYRIAQVLNKRKIKHEGNKIMRSLEFSPENQQTAFSILSYFREIVRFRHPQDKVNITIKQEGNKISLIVDPPSGKKEVYEEVLSTYGLVVTGKLAPEKLLDKDHQVLALRHKLELIEMEKKHACELLHCERNQYEKRIETLENELGKIHNLSGKEFKTNNEILGLISSIHAQQNMDLIFHLKEIEEKILAGLNKEDEVPVKKAFSFISNADPDVLKQFYDIAKGAASNITGQLIYEWIQPFMASMPI